MAHGRSLREHVAGQTDMCAVVAAQAGASPLTGLRRILGFSPLTADGRRAYRGALGELVVGDILENLGTTWDVLHDLPLGDRLLDHLVIGPAGVWAVRAVNVADHETIVDGAALDVGGRPQHDIPESIADATVVAKLLTAAAGYPVTVRPLLVVVHAARFSVRRGPADAFVVRATELHRFLTRAPLALDGEEVARISDLADLESSWPVNGTTRLDTQQLHRDFAVIRSQVCTALARRIGWAALGIGILYALVWGVIAALVGTIVAP